MAGGFPWTLSTASNTDAAVAAKNSSCFVGRWYQGTVLFLWRPERWCPAVLATARSPDGVKIVGGLPSKRGQVVTQARVGLMVRQQDDQVSLGHRRATRDPRGQVMTR